jgi:hypothetical protein
MRFGERTRSATPSGPSISRLWGLLLPLAVAIGLFSWAQRGSRGTGADEVEGSRAPPVSRNPPVTPFTEGKKPDRNVLDQFEDGSRHLAAGPYYHLLHLARRSRPEWLEAEARSDLLPVNIMEEPERYRGELVRLKGRVRRIVRSEASENPEGIVEQFESYLFDTDFHPRPVVVITPEAPGGLAPAQDLVENVETVGYFLGLWRYEVKGGKVAQAPVFMAAGMKVRESPRFSAPQVSLPAGLAILLMTLLALLGGYLLRFGSMWSSPPASTSGSTAPEPDFTSLEAPAVPPDPSR